MWQAINGLAYLMRNGATTSGEVDQVTSLSTNYNQLTNHIQLINQIQFTDHRHLTDHSQSTRLRASPSTLLLPYYSRA